ncbi:NUDIX domain-containing protein [Rhodococcus sp. SGAir0479]|uniref:NUDIX domain-containing protein n=1 Tax=Rhodococcus sp. SGAir0479 TaxID=2567884 RepID=UPI0010CD5202|nr:NUDIX domain-containing protein [Rhodococcus sp. SGAir0479]QCQ91455.1 NUDIX hydrolase [Rhodococcus sp. SGAir0479]
MDQSAVSVDVLAFRFGNPEPGKLRFAVAPRRWEPYTGQLALPGVLLGAGERLRDAARRAVTSKLGIPDDAIVAIGQLAVFDEPHRDPRGPTLSVTMWAVVTGADFRVTADTAVQWRPLDAPGDLAFDHNRIVADGRAVAGSRLLWHDITFTRALLGPEFPATYAVEVTTALTGTRPDAGNLNRTLKALPGLERTDERVRVQATGRPAVVWRWVAD